MSTSTAPVINNRPGRTKKTLTDGASTVSLLDMKTDNATAAQFRKISEEIRSLDRRVAKGRWMSRVQHTAERVEVLGASPVTSPAHQGLAWGLETGRLSSEMEEALRTMPAMALVRLAAKIATEHGTAPLRDAYEAWRSALMPVA